MFIIWELNFRFGIYKEVGATMFISLGEQALSRGFQNQWTSFGEDAGEGSTLWDLWIVMSFAAAKCVLSTLERLLWRGKKLDIWSASRIAFKLGIWSLDILEERMFLFKSLKTVGWLDGSCGRGLPEAWHWNKNYQKYKKPTVVKILLPVN